MQRIAFFLLICSFSASAMTGNELLALVTSSDMDKKFQGIRYIEGYRDAVITSKYFEEELAKEMKRAPNLHTHACIPQGVKNGQILDVVKLHLQNNPSFRHEDAAAQVHLSLITAWPCN